MSSDFQRHLRTMQLLAWVLENERPIDKLPSPTERVALRERWGFSRQFMASVLDVSEMTLVAAELGRFQSLRKLDNDLRYRRLLGFLSRWAPAPAVPESKVCA